MTATGSSTSIGLEKPRRRIARWREACPYRGAAMPTALWPAVSSWRGNTGSRRRRAGAGPIVACSRSGWTRPLGASRRPFATRRAAGLGPCRKPLRHHKPPWGCDLARYCHIRLFEGSFRN